MLRVGLTGSLGSGKTTVADLLRGLGAHVIEADALGRQLMEPGQSVYAEIVRAFGPEVVTGDGRLNRARLAQLAFQHGRLNDLNAIIHPAVIAAQQQWMQQVFAHDQAAVAVVESALIFEVVRDARARGEKEGVLADWRRRMDRIVLVTAPDELKIARYVARISPNGQPREAAEADARQRLAHQIPDAEKVALSDYVIDNKGTTEELRAKVVALWQRLKAESNNSSQNLSLE
ncbi:dephospho-CoA kinase [Telmatospirillum sp.]|uniref:dephospho-CoA kinase n=1 Tax=Telmatospirillum sp. TaxID=2079197 RepID=UPI002848C3A3|nr:dephospho-CoA kinase [Telmatospirillum sp.]MDR3438030.1 dephospho-CoA kinase [Telmatospirillum sp.]